VDRRRAARIQPPHHLHQLGRAAALCYATSMARHSPKPPSPRISWSADSLAFKPRLLTSAQFAVARRKRADLDEKMRQLRYAERERRH